MKITSRPLTHISWLLVCALALTACNLPFSRGAEAVDPVALGVAQTSVALTQAALTQAANPAASGDPVQPVQEPDQPQPPPDAAATSTLTLAPSLTLTPEWTPTVTLTATLSVPMVSVSRNTNCRTGPGEPYEIVGALMENEEAEVVGISSDGGTWIIKNPDGPGECWLWGYYATVTGPTEGLEVYLTPPTPTPEFTWAGNWTAYLGPTDDPAVIAYTLAVTVAGQNFSGLMDGAAGPMNLTGTISADYLSVSGNWDDGFSAGTFKFYALGTDQFQGNGSDPFGPFKWCGGKGGAGMPSPCYKP